MGKFAWHVQHPGFNPQHYKKKNQKAMTLTPHPQSGKPPSVLDYRAGGSHPWGGKQSSTAAGIRQGLGGCNIHTLDLLVREAGEDTV